MANAGLISVEPQCCVALPLLQAVLITLLNMAAIAVTTHVVAAIAATTQQPGQCHIKSITLAAVGWPAWDPC